MSNERYVWVPITGSGKFGSDPFRADIPPDAYVSAEIPSELSRELPERWTDTGDGKTPAEDPAPHRGDPAVAWCRVLLPDGYGPLYRIGRHLRERHGKDTSKGSAKRESEAPEEDRLTTELCRLPRDGIFMAEESAADFFAALPTDTHEAKALAARLLLRATRRGLRPHIEDVIANGAGYTGWEMGLFTNNASAGS